MKSPQILTWKKITTQIFNFNRIYDSYSFTVIPAMGQIIAGEWKSYQYLVESIRKFPDQVCPVISFQPEFISLVDPNYYMFGFRKPSRK